MANAAVIGAALQLGLTAPGYSLWVDGLDVAKQPGAAKGTAYGVADGSISVEEQPAGGVSALTFVVDDPLLVLTFTDGMPVLFWKHSGDAAYFRGYVVKPTATMFGLGRQWTVTCIGVEAWLD